MALETSPTVVLTREREDNIALATILRSKGVPVREIPCVETRYLQPDGWPSGSIDSILFTSRRGVRGFIRLKDSNPLLSKCSAENRPVVGAVGQKTADELVSVGIQVDLVAEPPEARNLVGLLRTRLRVDSRVVAICGNLRTGHLEVAIEQSGYALFLVKVYQNVAPEIPRLKPFPVAAVFIASPSAARRLLAPNPWLRTAPFLTIGPTTANALKGLGVERIKSTGTQFRTWIDRLGDSYRQAMGSSRQ